MDKEKKEFLVWLQDLRICGNVTAAINASGLKRTTLYRWKKEDQDFSKKWDFIVEDSKRLMADVAEHKLMQAAMEGNVTAQIFLLKHLRPEIYNTKPSCRNCESKRKSWDNLPGLQEKLVMVDLLPTR